MREPVYQKKFLKDYGKLKHSGRRSMEKLQNVMKQLIEGDWLLIYRLAQEPDGTETVTFCATDSHSNLFG